MVVASIARLCARPLALLGDQRQYMHGNWKLYAENTRDPYHASLLHLFHNTFGLYRSSQTGACLLDDSHRHTMLYAKAATSDAQRPTAKPTKICAATTPASSWPIRRCSPGARNSTTALRLVILSVFPNLVLQQIANTLAVRQIVTHGVDGFELVWTHFGYADDDDATCARYV